MSWLYPHASLGSAQCLCRDRPSQMARSWSAHSAWKGCWTDSNRRLQRQTERQLFKKRQAISIQYLTNCCVHIGRNALLSDRTRYYLQVALRIPLVQQTLENPSQP